MTGDGTVRMKDDGHSWLEAGAGEPLVLVHGIGGTTANWAPVIGSLSRAHHVFAWSFPGYDGARPLPEAAPREADYAARLLDFLERRGIERAHVVGHSLGAVVVAALARSAPGRVARLSLLCPVLGAGHLPPEERERVRQGRAGEIREGGMKTFAETRTASIVGPDVSPADLEAIIATMAAIPGDAYLQAWEMLCASQILPLLDAGGAPALVVGGAVDPVAPPAAVERVAEALGVTPHILPSVGHFPTHEATDALVDLISRHTAPAAGPDHQTTATGRS